MTANQAVTQWGTVFGDPGRRKRKAGLITGAVPTARNAGN
jgi:hypothetical protein